MSETIWKASAPMTIPSLPEEQPDVPEIDEEIPSAIPQSLMTAVSAVLVLALILGSASAIIFLTDWGMTFAVLTGLAVALVLVVAWFRMPSRSGQR